MTLIPITTRTTYCIIDCGKDICTCKPCKVYGGVEEYFIEKIKLPRKIKKRRKKTLKVDIMSEKVSDINILLGKDICHR